MDTEASTEIGAAVSSNGRTAHTDRADGEPERGAHTDRMPEQVAVAVYGDDRLAGLVATAVAGKAHVHRRLWPTGGDPVDPATLVQELVNKDVLAISFGAGVPLAGALAVAEYVDRTHAEVSVLLVVAPSSDLWRDAVRSGVRDVIDPASAEVDLAPALERALDRGVQLRPKPEVTADDVPETGRVIAVLSAKGGSGKTMLATNLAVSLAGLGRSVALLDLDVQFGDTSSALGLVPEHTISSVATTATIDTTALKVFLTHHAPSGVFVLCGTESPEEADAISDERASQVVEVLAADFDHLIVDTAAGVDDRMLAVMEHATDVVLIASMDVSSIRNLGKEMHALDRAGLLPDARHFVLNRSDSQLGLTAADVEGAIGQSIDYFLPSHRSVPLSMNQGRPIVLEDPASPVSREIDRLARTLAKVEDDDSGEARSLFGRRRRQR